MFGSQLDVVTGEIASSQSSQVFSLSEQHWPRSAGFWLTDSAVPGFSDKIWVFGGGCGFSFNVWNACNGECK